MIFLKNYIYICSENCRFVLKELDGIIQSVILKAVIQTTKNENITLTGCFVLDDSSGGLHKK